jgi:hypothetical protein
MEGARDYVMRQQVQWQGDPLRLLVLGLHAPRLCERSQCLATEV